VGSINGLGLAEAIDQLRAELTVARVSGATTDIHFPIETVSVELQVVMAKEIGGKAGFKVPVIDLEVGGERTTTTETTHTVLIVFGAPVDSTGNRVRVSRGSDTPKD
jgi:hypothetical protein